MTKIVTVLGARPQFIKASALSAEIRNRPGVEDVIVHTGQHYDFNMSDRFLEELQIAAPKYRLEVGSGTHGVQTGSIMQKLDAVLADEKPDWLLVYGDTNSTLAGALCAAKLGIRVAHVEAGLRSFNRAMPEEINRIVADHVADALFTPTTAASRHLVAEGIPEKKIFEVGDVMYDVALRFGSNEGPNREVLDELGLEVGGFFLATIHRAENTDDPRRLRVIFEQLIDLSRDKKVLLPLHPRTRAALVRDGIYDAVARSLVLTDPRGFTAMLGLERSAICVITDSGGVQKEAFFQRTPCITVRDETEWTELVEGGWNVLCPPLKKELRAALRESELSYRQDLAPYGDGKAAERILAVLTKNGE